MIMGYLQLADLVREHAPKPQASSLILTSLATRLCPVIAEAQTMMVTQLTAAPPNIANDHHRVKPLSSALPVQKPSDQGRNDNNKPLFADLIPNQGTDSAQARI
jgi:hypothetical protein